MVYHILHIFIFLFLFSQMVFAERAQLSGTAVSLNPKKHEQRARFSPTTLPKIACQMPSFIAKTQKVVQNAVKWAVGKKFFSIKI